MREMNTERFDEYKDDFNKLWSRYPRKIGKKQGLKSYYMRINRDGVTHDQLETALNNFLDAHKETDVKFIPHGSRFFAERYMDYLPDNFEPVAEEKGREPETKEEPKCKYVFEGYEEYLNTLKFMPYDHYIQTEHWKHFRKEAIKFFGNMCQLCNATQEEIHIHHKTYENRGRETFNDVIPLCDGCHKMVHGIKEGE